MDEDHPDLNSLQKDSSEADVEIDDQGNIKDRNTKLTPQQPQGQTTTKNPNPDPEPEQDQGVNSKSIPNKNEDYPETLVLETDMPSRGLIYDYDRLNFRGLIPDEEDKLESTQTLFGSRDVLRELVQNCTDVDIMDFTYGDLLSMYIWIRIETWNERYPYSIDCFHCDRTINDVFNLENLPVEFLDEDYEEPFVVYFGGKEIHLKQLRVRDEKRVENFIEKHNDRYPDLNRQQLNIKARRAMMIDQAPDVRDTIMDKMDFISELDTEEYAVIKKFSNDTTHGVGFRVNHECSNGHEFEAPLPFEPELLYPDPSDVIDMDDFTEPNG